MLTTVAFLALTIAAAEAGARLIVREHLATISEARRATESLIERTRGYPRAPGVRDDLDATIYISVQAGRVAAAAAWLERIEHQIGAIRFGIIAALPAAAFAKLALDVAEAARLAASRAEESALRCGS